MVTPKDLMYTSGPTQTSSGPATDPSAIATYDLSAVDPAWLGSPPGTPPALAGGEDPQLAQAIQMIKMATDVSRLEQMIGMFSMRMDQVEDPDERAGMERLLQVATDRLKELKAAEKPLNDWLKTKPKRTEENMKKFEAFKKSIPEALVKSTREAQKGVAEAEEVIKAFH